MKFFLFLLVATLAESAQWPRAGLYDASSSNSRDSRKLTGTVGNPLRARALCAGGGSDFDTQCLLRETKKKNRNWVFFFFFFRNLSQNNSL
jgi:hypothetical protein